MHLAPTECRLLSVLVTNAARVVTNPQLLRAVWGPSHAQDGHYLRISMGICGKSWRTTLPNPYSYYRSGSRLPAAIASVKVFTPTARP